MGLGCRDPGVRTAVGVVFDVDEVDGSGGAGLADGEVRRCDIDVPAAEDEVAGGGLHVEALVESSR